MDSETTGSGGTSGVRIVTRKSLFDKMKNENLRNLEEKLCFLGNHLFTQDNLTESQLNKLKHNFAHFKSEKNKSILHLAYKLPVKKYRQRKSEEEKRMEINKKIEIQTRFRNETGLLVDMPKANFGNTNDGNTSRRFFEDPKLSSDITGIDYELIYRLKVILETISSGYEINLEKYEKYAEETACLYVKLYPWHPMTPTLHKVLVHGSDIIKNALLPIGQLSEEAAEARNKHFRSYRQDYSRKFSRESCNRDILNRLLLSSDPFFSASRVIQKNKKSSFLPETLNMLVSATPNPADTLQSESEDEIN